MTFADDELEFPNPLPDLVAEIKEIWDYLDETHLPINDDEVARIDRLDALIGELSRRMAG